jgi:hypothetical protein
MLTGSISILQANLSIIIYEILNKNYLECYFVGITAWACVESVEHVCGHSRNALDVRSSPKFEHDTSNT